MAWIKLDDQFFRHPKVIRAGRDARDLYLAGLCFCGEGLTDGRIPPGALRILGAEADIDDARAAAATLVREQLWEIDADGGYLVHDFLIYNPPRERVLATREVRAAAGSRGGKQRASNDAASAEAPSKQNPSNLLAGGESMRSTPDRNEANGKQNTSNLLDPGLPDASHIAQAKGQAKSNPVPVPVPVPVNDPQENDGAPPAGAGAPPVVSSEKPKVTKEARRRTQLPVDWSLSDVDREFARDHGLSGREIAHNEKKFRNYHTSQASLMADWPAAWRTWVLKELESSPGGVIATTEGVDASGRVIATDRAPRSAANDRVAEVRRREPARSRQEEAEQAQRNADMARASALAAAETDPERPENVAPEVWMRIAHDQRAAYAAAARAVMARDNDAWQQGA